MRRLYAARRLYFIESFERHLGKWLNLRSTESGIQLVGLFHSGHDDTAVAEKARSQGINISPLSIQYQHGEPQRGLVMGFAASDDRTTDKGMRKLNQILSAAPS